MSRQFLLFCVSGGLAFVVDAGIVQALVSWGDANPYAARVVSFLAAVTFTWVFNRTLTFHDAEKTSRWSQWRQYVLTQLSGFAANYLTYAALVAISATVARWPAIGVAAGSAVGLVFNYQAAKRWVFRSARPTR
ncbi:MAG: GtrA family protein [Xanthomonadales bacterium]|nr:GtrA family protein [Xanthomonadales bacterium]